MKIYCQNCGSKIEFSPSNKPKFCQGCGSSLELGKSLSREENSDGDREADDIQDVDEDSVSVPNITGLEIDLEVPSQSKETLGDLVAGNSEGYTSSGPDNPYARETKKGEALENLKKEGGTLRQGNEPKNETG